MKEKLASILTTSHKRTVLSRRCLKTMQKLTGIERRQDAKITAARQHYNSLSSRSKRQFLKRFRMDRYKEATQFDSSIPLEEQVNAPLVVPGFDPPEMHLPEKSMNLPNFIRHDIMSPPKMPQPTAEPSGRGCKMTRGGARRGRGRGGAKY